MWARDLRSCTTEFSSFVQVIWVAQVCSKDRMTYSDPESQVMAKSFLDFEPVKMERLE